MQMTHVESSNVKAVGHNKDSSTLQVEFINGSTYQYFGVPESVFAELLNSDSVGGYLASDIKGTYKYSKV